MLNNSYSNAIFVDWDIYLNMWYGNAEDEDKTGFDNTAIDILLAQENIFDSLVEYVSEMDCAVTFDSSNFSDYLNEFMDEYEQTQS